MGGTSNFTLYTSHSAEGRSRKTKPISADMSSQYSTIPSFQHSSPGSLVQTKPIWRRRPEMSAAGESPQGQPRQTEPISARAMGGASAFRKRSYGKSYTQQASAKQSQFADMAPDGRRLRSHERTWRSGVLRQTNPICGSTNKPNPCPYADPEIGVPWRVNRAKQTQFLAPAGAVQGHPGRPVPSAEPIVQNKPNFGESAGGWNTHHSSILSAQHPKPMSMERNKANCGRSFKFEVSSVQVGQGRPTMGRFWP